MTTDYPAWICSDCGKRYGSRIPTLATFHMDDCGWCGSRTICTEPRDFGYPPMFENRPHD